MMDSLHPAAQGALAQLRASDPEMERNIGRHIRFRSPDGTNKRDFTFTIIGVQKDYKGSTIYRATCDGYQDTFGTCAAPEDIDFVDYVLGPVEIPPDSPRPDLRVKLDIVAAGTARFGEHRLQVRKVKALRGCEGLGFAASVYLDDQHIASVRDEGNGGAMVWEAPRKGGPPDLDALAFLIEQHVPELCFNIGRRGPDYMAASADLVVEELANDLVEKRAVLRSCWTVTFFRTADQGTGEYYRVNQPFSKATKTRLLREYPDAIFLNETIAGQKA